MDNGHTNNSSFIIDKTSLIYTMYYSMSHNLQRRRKVKKNVFLNTFNATI